jgi:glutathione S-transferase
LTIADIAIFIFVHSSKWCGLDVHEFPHLEAWKDKLAKRPAFQKGLNSPAPYAFSDDAVTNPDNQEFYKTIRKMGTPFIKQATDLWSKGDPVPLPSDHSNFA